MVTSSMVWRTHGNVKILVIHAGKNCRAKKVCYHAPARFKAESERHAMAIAFQSHNHNHNTHTHTYTHVLPLIYILYVSLVD